MYFNFVCSGSEKLILKSDQLEVSGSVFSACSQALMHFIIVAAKYYIYNSIFFYKKKLSIEGFERYLKINFLNEQYIA